MHQEFSLAYLSAFGVAPPDMIDLAWRTGFDYVGLRLNPVTADEPVFPLVSDRNLLIQTRRRLADTGIRVLDVELIRMTPDFDIDSCCAILDAGAELSARHVLAQAADPDPSRASDHLAQLCDAARTRELTVDLEFVTWTETRDLDTAALIVQAAGRENAGILIDTLHFARSNCSVAHLARLPREWFRYVQVCDAPAEPPRSVEELIHAARSDRLFLGEGGLDLIGILGALPRATPYALEIPRTALARVIGLEECVRLALSSARKFVQALPVSTGLVPRLPSEAHAARSH